MDGILIINKQKGYTSHDVVAKVKKILKIKKVGHTGTLDPNATGVLPLLLNNGTKLSKYLIEHDKEYEVTLKLGIKTDTLDSEGKILETKDVEKDILEIENVKKVLNSFIGKQKQLPPMYSAIKVNGKKLYEYARKGETIEINPRDIEIYNIELENINNTENEIIFKVSCSKGTYIRSLCDDIAVRLGTIGYMNKLNRLSVGSFKLKDAITIDKLEENVDNKEFLSDVIIDFKKFFEKYEKIDVEETRLKHFLNGVKITVNKKDGIYNVYSNNKYIGIGVVENKLLKRDIIL